jgi:hypothetical protein
MFLINETATAFRTSWKWKQKWGGTIRGALGFTVIAFKVEGVDKRVHVVPN